jgi:polysaccharide biosynthesis protein PslG
MNTGNGLLQFHRKEQGARLLAISLIAILVALSRGYGGDDENVRLKLLGTVKTKSSIQITNSPWGIQAGSQDEPVVAKAGEIGVKWTRLQATWAEIESERGVYNWEKTDKAFSTALKNGITPFVTINGTNKLYVNTRTDLDPKVMELYGNIPMPPTSDPRALKAWLSFVEQLILRYKDRIKYWEIWNEPNHFAFWGSEPSGKEYGALVKQGATLIRKLDPQAFVLAGALAGLDPKFTDDFLSVGNKDLVDIITFHNYSIIPEERIYKAVEVWDVIRKHNPRIRLWQGECGTASNSSTSGYRGVSPWGPVIQAKWLLRQSFTDTYFCRAEMSNYFLLGFGRSRKVPQKRDFLTSLDSVLGFPDKGGTRVRAVGTNEKCLLENPGMKPKPGFYAYQNLCAVMDGRYKPSDVTHKVTIKDPGIFYGIGPDDDAFPSVPLVASFSTADGSSLLAYWVPWHPQEIICTATIDLETNIQFKHPVLVDLLSGRVYEIEEYSKTDRGCVLRSIPLADYPFILMERDQIELVGRN